MFKKKDTSKEVETNKPKATYKISSFYKTKTKTSPFCNLQETMSIGSTYSPPLLILNCSPFGVQHRFSVEIA